MKELEILLDRRWVLKSEDKELYYKIRDSIGEIRRFATEKMGCQVIENALLVKLEKIPAVPESCMGIRDFTSKEEYAFLCILLMFLEDKDGEEQFILSQLTEYIEANMPGQTVDWTLFSVRRKLVKVLRYAVSQGILKITDGSDDVFMDEQSGEVLYENTGASRYFMRSFSKDIMDYTKPEDFQESDWFEMDEDRGIARRHRVYKRLLFSMGMYRAAGGEEDFEYLKYYGRRLCDDLEQNFPCQLHIHKGGAFLVLGQECHMGLSFPGNNVLSDIMLLCCTKVRENVEKKRWKIRKDETVFVEITEFEQMLKKVKKEFGSGFTKKYREMPDGEFIREIISELEYWTLIERKETEQGILIHALAGKVAGYYSSENTGGNKK